MQNRRSAHVAKLLAALTFPLRQMHESRPHYLGPSVEKVEYSACYLAPVQLVQRILPCQKPFVSAAVR